MRDAYSLASEHIQSPSSKGKKQHDKKVTYSTLEAGDRVLVRNLTECGGFGKLRSHWQDMIHVVVNVNQTALFIKLSPKQGKDDTKFYTRTCC